MKQLALLTSRIIGTPYKLGGRYSGEGMDCLGVILAACEFWGVDVPESFEGYTKENYADKYRQNPVEAKEMFFRVLGQLGQEIPASQAFAGDLLLLSRNGERGVALHGGGDRVISSFFEQGVRSAGIRSYQVEKAYRLRRKN